MLSRTLSTRALLRLREQRRELRIALRLGARDVAAEPQRLGEQRVGLIRLLGRGEQHREAERCEPVLWIEPVHERERAVGVLAATLLQSARRRPASAP